MSILMKSQMTVNLDAKWSIRLYVTYGPRGMAGIVNQDYKDNQECDEYTTIQESLLKLRSGMGKWM